MNGGGVKVLYIATVYVQTQVELRCSILRVTSFNEVQVCPKRGENK